jgi:RND superfamily putative drug exporter
MLRRLTWLALERRRWVLSGAIILLPLLAVIGGNVESHLSVGGFDVPDSESSRGERILEDEFSGGSEDWILVITAKDAPLTSPQLAPEAAELAAAIQADPGVLGVSAYTEVAALLAPFAELVDTAALNPLVDVDGEVAIIGASLAGDEDEQRATAERLLSFTGESEHWTSQATGSAEIARQASEQAELDLTRAEMIAAPLTLFALIVVFRGLRTALLPLAVAIFAVLGTYVVLTAIAQLTTVSVFALNLTTGLGLGLGIDYCLLMVARYREELAQGHEPDIALERTVQTAGRTVLFSGATVASSLLALLVFPAAYLRSFAFAGVGVVVVACGAAVIVLPALLAWMGDRVAAKTAPPTESFWGLQARRVIRRPVAYVVVVGAVLVLAGLPFFRFEAGRIDERVLPEDATAREAATTVRDRLDFGELNSIAVILPDGPATDTAASQAMRDELLALPDVVRVVDAAGFAARGQPVPLPASEFNAGFDNGSGQWLRVTAGVDPDTTEAEDLVEAIRAIDNPFDGALIVSGTTAKSIDTVDAVLARLPLAMLIIAVVTLVVLFLMTGSILVPLKAVVLNLLSLTAAFGALVWIFQEGNFSDALGFTATGSLDIFTPILMFCVAFGLSMDYEVFLISRIKEEYDLTGDNDEAIVRGIGSTGRVVTAAAVLLAIVFVAISTSEVTIVKMFGFGLMIAVIVDAFLVRATLTPALMKLAGRANWWAPEPLRRFHLRYGLWENEPIRLPDPDPVPHPPSEEERQQQERQQGAT